MKGKRKIVFFAEQTWNHLKSFWMPWLFLGVIFGVSFFDFADEQVKMWLIAGFMLAFVVALIIKPMNIIYGLIGTHGYIWFFFLLLIGINFLFGFLYYNTFFRHAGITYDTNQPHVDFLAFQGDNDSIKDGRWVVNHGIVTNSPTDACVDSACCCGLADERRTIFEGHEALMDSAYYYRVSFPWVLRNTFLTSLMQEPTDFFSVSGVQQNRSENVGKHYVGLEEWFHWFLIFHILVSWILLGVFISLIYQKFRNT